MTRKTLTTAVASAALLAALGTTAAHAGDMKANHFSKVDVNADAQVDFTEFYNYVSPLGVSDADAAQEFVRLAGPENVITEDGFASFDKASLKAKHAGATHTSTETMADTSYQTVDNSYNTGTVTTFSNDQMVVLGTTSVSGDFASYDANSDGLVNFDEYAKVATSNGVTKTAAAREFIQISGGQTQFDQNAFNNIQYMSAPNYESSDTSYNEPSVETIAMDSEMTYSSDTSGAYTAPSIDVNVDPTVGIEVETDNPVEDAWEDTKDVTSDVWEDTKDVTSDAWDATKDAASDTMEKAEDIVEPDQ